ncbi:MAG: dephospho-CoA kinase [Prevotellaceae bacterium]|nr:dephospho-CoA kinase [Prevotellaceae bacterium]
MMRRIGVTGGIGSGKSFVCGILRERLNVPCYDCDKEAQRIMGSDPAVREALRKLLGSGVFLRDGSLNKPLLSGFLFASEHNARRVNAIVHPAVRRDLREWLGRQEAPTVCVESAILLESGFDEEVDEILVVTASPETRLRRAMRRLGATQEDVEARMRRQDTGLALGRATHVISNETGTSEEDILNQLKKTILC